MTSFPETGSASIDIAADPKAVWQLVADITRMGEWSPECIHAEWQDGATAPAVGAHFIGSNKIGDFEWSVPCIVTECEPGSVFAFEVPRGAEVRTTWRFEFAANPTAGTTLTESFNAPLINVDGSAANFEGRHEMLVAAIATTVANVKAAAEQ